MANLDGRLAALERGPRTDSRRSGHIEVGATCPRCRRKHLRCFVDVTILASAEEAGRGYETCDCCGDCRRFQRQLAEIMEKPYEPPRRPSP
jgi:hypothetical protein